MTDRTPTEPTWLLKQGAAPEQALERIAQRIAVWQDADPDEDESWESFYSAAFDMLSAEVDAIISAVAQPLAASRAAPGAEVEPVAGLRYRSLEYDDWGMIRNPDDSLFAVVRRPLGEDEAAAHRKAKTDPFEPLARVLMSALASPPTTDAIKAQALREALEGAKAAVLDHEMEWARKAAEPGRSDIGAAIFGRAASAAAEIHADIQRLADKPGEAE